MNNDQNQPVRDQLFELADMVFDGAASVEDIDQLATLLDRSPELRGEYLRYALVHGQLALTTLAFPHLEPVGLPSPGSIELTSDDTSERFDSSGGVQASFGFGFLRTAVGVSAIAATVLVAVGIWNSGTNRMRQQDAMAGKASIANRASDDRDSESVPSHYDNRDFPISTVAMLFPTESGRTERTSDRSQSRSISPTTLKVGQGETRFASAGGVDVRVEGPAMFGVSSQTGGILFDGSVRARLENRDASFSVLTSNLRVVDLGTEFRVTVMDDQHVKVHVLDGEVDVQSRVRLPLFYWNFDSVTDSGSASNNRLSDMVSGLAVSMGPTAKATKGIAGDGALAFDNTPTSFARVTGGTGDKVSAGGMAFSSGITIEAMFISRWTGNFRDYDEFFRKEDGIYRMLLSFQNDGNNNRFDLPDVDPGPCLSFGLHLEQQGYSELDMPLDGRDGRPSVKDLTDGKPHHLVATYDSFTGRKAIFIDGRLCFEHTFPIGILILSGGPAPAEIGNTRQLEPFNGVIDEVAFYDFALTPAEIAAHYQNASSGATYFGVMTDRWTSVRWQSVTRITEGQTRVFNQITGLPLEGQNGAHD